MRAGLPWLAIACLLGLGVLGVRGITSGELIAVESYQEVDDGRLVIGVTTGPGQRVGVEKVVETNTEVQILVRRAVRLPFPGADVGVGVELEVTLAGPLGGRTVRDALGNEVPEYRPPLP